MPLTKCTDCVYWDPWSKKEGWEDEPGGICRRKAPQGFPVAVVVKIENPERWDDPALYFWPETTEEDGCGEGEPK